MWPFDLIFPLITVSGPQMGTQGQDSNITNNHLNLSQYLPIVTMHGINDDHRSCLGLIETLKASMPGVHVVNLVLGESRQKERDHSVFMGMEEQVEWACRLVKADPLLAGGYTGIGFSQGGLLLRGLAQLCPQPPMLKLITLGTPHQGIAGLPRCPGPKNYWTK